ncbi:MAG: DNA polymerase IV [Bacteroidales bacterium]
MHKTIFDTKQNRNILHLDLDSFFVAVERLRDSCLNGRPVIIGGLSGRGVVSSCSYEARRFGVHSAMPMKMARQLCGDAVFLRGDMEAYTHYSRLVTDVIHEEAPLYEKASIDEHYLDVTGIDRFFGLLKWSQELRQRIIKETGLPISMGLSVNKTVSKIATGEAKPNGELYVKQPRVKPFLAPLSIRKIPMVGKESFRLLRSMGIARVQTLQEMPPDMIMQVMGKNGLMLWKKANGIDNTPVTPYSERKSISTETTFEKDTTNIQHIRQLLAGMVEKLAYELRSKQKLTSVITVKIRYANFDTHTRQKRIPYTSFDHVLIKLAQELFNELYQRRMLLRLVGVRFSGLVGGMQQINMFEDTPEMVNLYQAMDRMRNRFGQKAVQRASGMKEQEGKT